MVATYQPYHYPDVDLNANLVGTCADHTIHVAIEQSLVSVRKLKAARKKIQKFVNYSVESVIARQ